jgi:hypothetical protein
MNQEVSLSLLYGQYMDKLLTKIELEDRIFRYLINNFNDFRLCNGNLETWHDYLSWLYPRLSRAIENYKDMGFSFGVYIKALIYKSYKSYKKRQAYRYATEHAIWQAKAEEMLLHENEPEYFDTQSLPPLARQINPKQILFLLLKSFCYIDDEILEQAAKTVGLKAHAIKKMVEELQMRRAKREKEVSELRSRLEAQYFRCVVYQKRLLYHTAGTDAYGQTKSRLEQAKKRYNRMKKRLKGMRRAASNRLIAEVMGIPKGTVDSGLSLLKKNPAARKSLA